MKEHFKELIAVAVVLVGVITFIVTSDLTAKTSVEMPKISTMQIVAYDIKTDIYTYTGEAIEPTFSRLVLEDAKGKRQVVYRDAYSVESYKDNIECGYADMVLTIDGYKGTVTLENVFQIQPAQAQNLQITQASREAIHLTWDEQQGVVGYLLYKSKDGGKSFTPIKQVLAGEKTEYQDKEVELNANYLYYVRAFSNFENKIICGDESAQVKQQTPLETPVLTKASNVSYNSIKLQWNSVPGAAGYQVYRSLTKDGKFEKIAELTDGKATTYTDCKCDLGIPYFYYIKACQALDSGKVYGDASGIQSAKTTPNRVGISGTTSNNDTEVTLKWSKSSGAQGYEVYKSQSASSGYQLVQTIESADTLSWKETGLGKEAVYYYKIRPYSVVNGTKITGSYSGVYEKEITIVYAEISGDIAALTQYVGRPYVWGGTSPKGWDCSGFVQHVFKKHFGISLPRTSGQQAGGGKKVSLSNRSAWQPGDLIFYKGKNGNISHVAIYLGNGQMIHALNERYDTLVQGVSYYENWDPNTTMVAVRRYFK